ncbi:hypothetical protein AWC27_20515 [Mycobacterium szulgai]|uniref:DUF732 domain-containing protein n=2 Tax=Mycobacterium szulgai TaxID=1787 RepID=A0A1X2F7A4_MYCSZ|nr:DUF732 domain-containing protein [Mycobacterium szulgai]ORX14310.1 hypothetical protein AWC27_20515 [Mycobacterium szulgai]
MALMVESHPAADNTGAVNRDQTVAVPNAAPTDAVEVAWSRGEEAIPDVGAEVPGDGEYDVASEPVAAVETWRSTWGRAAALLLVGLGLAGAIVLGHWALTRSPSSGKPAPVAPASSSAATTTAPNPASINSTPDQDNKYIQDLSDRGISFANPEAAVYNGKMVCLNIGQGMTVQQIVAEFRNNSPAFSSVANDYVAISVRTYCPQHNNLVAGF